MATINDLRISITEIPYSEVVELLHTIRANRRRRPEKPLRAKKSTPAKVARAPKKTNLKQQDIFAFTTGLSADAKKALAAELMKGLIG